MIDRDKVAEQALALPREDRAYLVDVIERSLAEPAAVDPIAAKAWSAEIDRRIDEVNRGDVRTVSAEDMLQAIQRELDARRARRAI